MVKRTADLLGKFVGCINLSQMSNKKRIYSSSSEEEDDDDDYMPKASLPKSAVFNFKVTSAPIIEDKNEELDVSRQEAEQDDNNLLKPKLRVDKQPQIPNRSGVYLKNVVSEQKLAQKELTAAYTFKLKSPAGKKKKSDPVALFQQTSTVWKKDKFLTSRGNNKQGRKLDLDKRNKDLKTIV